MTKDEPSKSKLELMLEKEHITEEEAIQALTSARKVQGQRVSLPLTTNHFKYGYFSDPHIGSQKFSDELFDIMAGEFKSASIDFVVNPGDHLEGMSNRPGHIYELSEIGFENQITKAADLYNQLPKPIYGIDGNHDCGTEDVEALTKRGWMHVGDLTSDDEFFTLNQTTLKGEWQKADEIIRKLSDTQINVLESKQISLSHTSKHRIVHRVENKLKFVRIEDLPKNSNLDIPVSAIEDKKKLDINDDKIKLTAWILTDGYIAKYKHYKTYRIYQSKPIEEIESILKRLKYEYYIYEHEPRKKNILGKEIKSYKIGKTIQISMKHNKELEEFIPQKDPIPDWIWNMNNEQFLIFLRELIKGDGSVYDRKKETYILYGRKSFLDNIQALIHTNGWRGTLTKTNRDDYRLNIIAKNVATVVTKDIKQLKNSEKTPVWCLTIKNSNFMVRRNGKCYFTGNSWYYNKADHGIIVGKELELRVKDYKNLGQDEGWIDITPKVNIMLFHGNDGTSYADSYKLQKLIESFDENEKPSILHSGHYHKSLYLYRRGVHGFESATLCEQSKFMRGKKIPAHMGFGIVDVVYNTNGIVSLDHKFFPYTPSRR